ncbi:hypothetical protein Q8A67_000799 [Cirrhinus molitorella]|uniref:Uncharacterized protein n=1 Tax=Cirrhinus molitorella TaxID=172907 RepID=A0AA88QGJ9_9TELE|nr:hypothetical protein Q8A67_000799 [Cirrhinus molitorella]
MGWAEEYLSTIRQDGQPLEQYVEEYVELSHLVIWSERMLSVCFLMGLDEGVIRFLSLDHSLPFFESINLILWLNGSDFIVEEVPRPVPSHKLLSTPTHPKPATKPSTHSSPSEFPAKMGTSSESPAKMESVDFLDLTLPLEFNTPILSPESPLSPLVLSSPPVPSQGNRSMPSVVDGLENSGEARQKDGEKTREVICRARNQRDSEQARVRDKVLSTRPGWQTALENQPAGILRLIEQD